MILFTKINASNARMVKSLILGFLLQALVFVCVNGQNSNCATPDNLPGVCIGIRQCPLLLSLLQMQPLKPGTVDFLRKSQCGFSGQDPQVCCQIRVTNTPPRDQLSGEKTGSNQISQPENNVVTNDANLQYDVSNNPLLPTDCGKDVTQRIIGGNRTDLDEFPWMCLLEYVKPDGKSTSCGGVLISSRYVLTAAHCLKGKDLPKTWRLESVRLGEYNTATETDCISDGSGGFTCADDPISVGIEEQIAHENYRPISRGQKYDIALLRLSREVAFTNYIKPICLPSNANFGQKLFVAGWGKTENGSSSEIKLKLSLPLTDKQQCQQTYGNAGVSLGYGQICAGGQKGKDSCRGDSGGPLMSVEETKNGFGKWSVVGVVSFGPYPCGMAGWPGVYTRVIDFVPWILSKMRP